MDKNRAGCGDAGGDILVALNACISNVLTSDELDAEIDNVFFEKEGDYRREWCGIEKMTWHQLCIEKALTKKYGSRVTWKKMPKSSIYQKGHGKLYVHGILNHKFFGQDSSGNWQHAICIDTNRGMVFELNLGTSWHKLSNFFHKKPHKNDLLSEIWHVRKLEILDIHVNDAKQSDETFGLKRKLIKLEDQPLLNFVHEMNQDEMFIPFVQLDDIALPLRVVEVKKSDIAGRGIFAIVDIPKGFDFGRYCPHTSVTKSPLTGSEYGLEIDTVGFIDGMGSNGEIVHWTALMNHSFKPNVTFLPDGSMKVLHPITKGQELFIDYGIKYWKTIFSPITRKHHLHVLLTHNLTKEQMLLKEQLFEKFDVNKMFQDHNENIHREIQKRKKLVQHKDTSTPRKKRLKEMSSHEKKMEKKSEFYRLELSSHETKIEEKSEFYRLHLRQQRSGFMSMWHITYSKTNTLSSADQILLQRLQRDPDCVISIVKLPAKFDDCRLQFKDIKQITLEAILDLRESRLDKIRNIIHFSGQHEFVPNKKTLENWASSNHAYFYCDNVKEEYLESLKYLSKLNQFLSVWRPSELTDSLRRTTRICNENFLRTNKLFKDVTIQTLVTLCLRYSDRTFFQDDLSSLDQIWFQYNESK